MDGDNGRLLKNAWYVCAWAGEIGERPLQRWICGEPEPARPIRWGIDKGVTHAHRRIERLLAEEAGTGRADSAATP